MNKTALKTFATNARRELLSKVKAEALKIGVTKEDSDKATIESSDAIYIGDRQLLRKERIQRDRLIERIKQIGFDQVMDEVAYTWFNRFTALRFMEVNNYLPTKVRVLSSSLPETNEPDMIREALSLNLDIDKERVYEWKEKSQTNELFKYLIIKHCNDLNRYMPFMFEKIDDYTEILFPEGLLQRDSFVRLMTNTEVIKETDWEKVEIIGWLYQYYIADENERVIKAKKKYTTEEIPFATQLFTPEWIVRYMVQNTLGRYWLESYPDQRDLLENWEFYLEDSKSDPDFNERLAPYVNKELKIEEIKCFDPAMGSGHILVYMFDVLYEIYVKCGYMEKEIPRLIIEKNLYGLDIDDRAYQLACFSVVIKALQYNKRFFRSIERDGLTLNLAAIQETNTFDDEDIAYIAGDSQGDHYQNIKEYIDQFKDAKTLGSLIQIKVKDKNFLMNRIKDLNDYPAKDLFDEEKRKKGLSLLNHLLVQSDIMSDTYDVFITNPPYMSYKYMNTTLLKYLNSNYKHANYDLFSAFVDFSYTKVKDHGQIGFMTPYVWMFLTRFEKFRQSMIENKTITSLIQLEYSSFEEATVPICTFTMRNSHLDFYSGEFISLSNFKGAENQPKHVLKAIENTDSDYRFNVKTGRFNDIPGKPIAFWASDHFIKTFDSPKFRDSFISESLNLTGNNHKYLRKSWEVNHNNIGREKKWLFYAKGGGYRKWWGNLTDVVNWSPEAISHYKSDKIARIIPEYLWYKKGITWGFVTSARPSFRVLPEEATFDIGGASVFFEDYRKYNYFLAFLNSIVCEKLLEILNPTLNFQMNNIGSLPLVEASSQQENEIIRLSEECVQLSKDDWDSFEISTDFTMHPLLSFHSNLIEIAYHTWSTYSKEKFFLLKNNEEKINSMFIDIYRLRDELSPYLDEGKLMYWQVDKERSIKSFISYSVGCILGRYSLDEQGLIYTGGSIDFDKYSRIKVDRNNILPILPGAYFEDDILSSFIEFVQESFGDQMLAENLDFIASAIGRKKNETAKETLRRYFLNDFFKHHLQTYKKRPIYWLFTSGKQKAFNCLIYMNRYDKSTLSRIRTDYLHEYQNRLDVEKKDLLNVIENGPGAKVVSKVKKELLALEKKMDELKAYDEKLHHMADQQIEIDLDDGVKVNYEKFEGLVVKI